ncbi:hypothetical protein BMS3Abin03_00645 [bacterium BMS3Abin03]|nr:hypothetical protein BMS3Abin03_00645 [bacterium BMS3Abin03]
MVEIRDDEIDIKTPKGIVSIKNHFVFAMTGYHPNYDFLKKAGVDISEDEIMKPKCDDDSLETNIKGIYLAGVVCAGMETGRLFIENSRSHAVNIFNHIESKSY